MPTYYKGFGANDLSALANLTDPNASGQGTYGTKPYRIHTSWGPWLDDTAALPGNVKVVPNLGYGTTYSGFNFNATNIAAICANTNRHAGYWILGNEQMQAYADPEDWWIGVGKGQYDAIVDVDANQKIIVFIGMLAPGNVYPHWVSGHSWGSTLLNDVILQDPDFNGDFKRIRGYGWNMYAEHAVPPASDTTIHQACQADQDYRANFSFATGLQSWICEIGRFASNFNYPESGGNSNYNPINIASECASADIEQFFWHIQKPGPDPFWFLQKSDNTLRQYGTDMRGIS